MKIAIPAENMNGLDSIVYGHFGSAPYFIIYDNQTDLLTSIDNSNKEHEHGQCQPVDELRTNKIEAVVCGGMGVRAVNNLNSMGIKVYLINNTDSIKEIIKHLKNNELEEMNIENACRHHDCH